MSDEHNPGQREFDDVSEAWSANQKALFDDFRSHVEGLRTLQQANLSNVITATAQMNTNMVAQSNAVNQQIARLMTSGVGYDSLAHAQSVAHRDVAVNKEWNNPFNLQAFRAADEHAQGSPHSHSGGVAAGTPENE